MQVGDRVMEVRTKQRNISNSSRLEAFFSIAVALSYYLSQYSSFIPGITLGELFLVLAVAALLIQNKGRVRVSNTRIFLGYYIVALISSVIALAISKPQFSLASITEIITRWIRYFGYIVFYVVFCDGVPDKRRIIKAYRYICLAVSVYAILQYVIYLLFRFYLPVNILPFSISRDVSAENLISVAQSSLMRARAVFVEPGYLAKFLLPGIILSFYGWEELEDDKVNWLSVVIISVAILMSGSVQGIMTLAISYLLVGFARRSITSKHILYGLIVIVGVFVTYIVMQRTGFLARPINRIINLLQGESMDRSTQLRVFRGFAYWWQLPIEQKLFGVGMGNAANYANEHNIYTVYDYYYRTESTLGYMSGISSILVTHGFVCALMFVGMIIKFKKIIGKAGFAILTQYVVLLFGGGSFLSVLGVLYFCLAFSDILSINDKESI